MLFTLDVYYFFMLYVLSSTATSVRKPSVCLEELEEKRKNKTTVPCCLCTKCGLFTHFIGQNY